MLIQWGWPPHEFGQKICLAPRAFSHGLHPLKRLSSFLAPFAGQLPSGIPIQGWTCGWWLTIVCIHYITSCTYIFGSACSHTAASSWLNLEDIPAVWAEDGNWSCVSSGVTIFLVFKNLTNAWSLCNSWSTDEMQYVRLPKCVFDCFPLSTIRYYSYYSSFTWRFLRCFCMGHLKWVEFSTSLLHYSHPRSCALAKRKVCKIHQPCMLGGRCQGLRGLCFVWQWLWGIPTPKSPETRVIPLFPSQYSWRPQGGYARPYFSTPYNSPAHSIS